MSSPSSTPLVGADGSGSRSARWHRLACSAFFAVLIFGAGLLAGAILSHGEESWEDEVQTISTEDAHQLPAIFAANGTMPLGSSSLVPLTSVAKRVMKQLQPRRMLVACDATKKKGKDKNNSNNINIIPDNPQPGPTGGSSSIDAITACERKANTMRQLAKCAIGHALGTTGGLKGRKVVVDTTDDNKDKPAEGTLRYYAMQSEPLWITFKQGVTMNFVLEDMLVVGSDKTIDGRGSDVHITRNGFQVGGRGPSNNVIIHNINFENCDMKMDLTDCVRVFKASTNVWVDRCSLSRGSDGLLDVTQGATRVLATRNHFHHHRKGVLLGASMGSTMDTVIRVTLAYNWFEEIFSRQPRIRFGEAHSFSNVYEHWGDYILGMQMGGAILSESNIYIPMADGSHNRVSQFFDPPGTIKSKNDRLMGGAYLDEMGSRWATTPYPYTVMGTLRADIDYIKAGAGARVVPLPPDN